MVEHVNTDGTGCYDFYIHQVTYLKDCSACSSSNWVCRLKKKVNILRLVLYFQMQKAGRIVMEF